REASEEPQTGWSLRRHVSQTHSEASFVSDHPVRAFFRNGSILLIGASTPPLQGGECTYPKSVSNMKWDTALAQVLVAQDSGNGFRLHHGADDCFGNCFGREGADGAVVGRDVGCSG